MSYGIISSKRNFVNNARADRSLGLMYFLIFKYI